MKKVRIVGILCLAALAVGGYAANILQDPGFEHLTGTEPQTNTSPWTAVEPTTFPVASVAGVPSITQHFHSGTNAVVYNYYSISPTARFYQNTGTVIEAGKDYEASIWALLDDKSTSSANSNSTTFNMAIYTSTNIAGPYTYRIAQFANIPTTTNVWQQFTRVFTAAQISGWVGEYMSFQIIRPNTSVQYRLYLDDASFGPIENKTLRLIGIK